MFIDVETVDKLFEIGYQHNNLITFGIFDKRVLLPLEQAAWSVSQAIGTTMTAADLTHMAARGWIPLLRNPHDPEEEMGVPLYVPPRIEFLLALERGGYMEEELRIIAEDEEVTIDAILTTDELAYIDDDLEAVIQHLEGLLVEAERQGSSRVTVDRSGTQVAREKFEWKLHMYQKFRQTGIPEPYQYLTAKIAFRIRAQAEVTRVSICEMDRAKVRAGYSPFVVCCRDAWHFDGSITTFTAEPGVYWEPTIRSALAHTEGEIPTIRVPGFVLYGDKIVSTQTLTPHDYEQRWKQHDLDQYRLRWAEIQGQRRCLHCLVPLQDSASGRRMYCSEKCRNASKQKRYRQRNPEAVKEAQQKYWDQFRPHGGVGA